MYNGYLEDRLVVLEIFEGLPHMKTKSAEFDRWQTLIHGAIDTLAGKSEIPYFERAHIGLYTQLPTSSNHKVWDISNRAVNVTINNLKGIFFPDDDAEHLSITVIGKFDENPKTIICIGDFCSDYEKVNFWLRYRALDPPGKVS